MAINIRDFFRFGSNYPRLLRALFEESGEIDDIRLLGLIRRYVDDDAPSSQTIQAQLLAYGIMGPSPWAETIYEMGVEVRNLLAWLLKRQDLATAEVIRGYLEQLQGLRRELEETLVEEDWAGLEYPLADLERVLEQLRSYGRGNFESIATQVQDLQGGMAEMEPRERFRVINRIWQRFLVPLREVIDDRGLMTERLDFLDQLLVELCSNEGVPAPLRRRATWARSRLRRTRRELGECHVQAVREVEPLYEQLRAENLILQGASRLLKELRVSGESGLSAMMSQRFRLEGWRLRGLISDDHLGARMIILRGYEPSVDIMLPEAPAPVDWSPLQRAEIRGSLLEACPISDVFGFVVQEWSHRSLSELLRVYGWIHRGDFGPCERREGVEEQTYFVGDKVVFAWPMTLERVV